MEEIVKENTEIKDTPVNQIPEPTKKIKKLYKNKFVILGIIIVFTMVLLGSYFLLNSNNNFDQKTTASTPAIALSPSPTSTIIPTAISSPTPYKNTPPVDSKTKPGWKTYTSGYTKMSFDFPSTWKFEVLKNINSDTYESVRITSPEGMTIDFDPKVSGLGGGCDESNCPTVRTIKTTPLEGSKLFLVEGSYSKTKRLGIMSAGTLRGHGSIPQLGETKTFPYYMLFLSQSGEDTAFLFDESLQSNLSDTSKSFYMRAKDMTDQEFFNLPIISTAKEILSSLRF